MLVVFGHCGHKHGDIDRKEKECQQRHGPHSNMIPLLSGKETLGLSQTCHTAVDSDFNMATVSMGGMRRSITANLAPGRRPAGRLLLLSVAPWPRGFLSAGRGLLAPCGRVSHPGRWFRAQALSLECPPESALGYITGCTPTESCVPPRKAGTCEKLFIPASSLAQKIKSNQSTFKVVGVLESPEPRQTHRDTAPAQHSGDFK